LPSTGCECDPERGDRHEHRPSGPHQANSPELGHLSGIEAGDVGFVAVQRGDRPVGRHRVQAQESPSVLDQSAPHAFGYHHDREH
jgi:hypothetical protein